MPAYPTPSSQQRITLAEAWRAWDARPGDSVAVIRYEHAVAAVAGVLDTPPSVLRDALSARRRSGMNYAQAVADVSDGAHAPILTCTDATQNAPVVETPKLPLVTRRESWWPTAWPAAYVDLREGLGLTDAGEPFDVPRAGGVGALLDALPVGVRLVHITGPRPGDSLDGFHAWRNDHDGWAAGGHFLARAMFPVLRYEQAGRKVTLQRAATWLGGLGDRVGPHVARAGMRAATAALAARFPSFGGLLATPGTTGRRLLATVVAGEWPVLDGELQELIRSTSGQGRIELVRPGAGVSAVHQLDGRAMYLGLAQAMPAGEVTRWTGEPDVPAHTRARYRCTWTVPAAWAHVGLLPAMDSAGGWRWPSAPGERAAGWIDGVELYLARGRGWAVEVHEAITWAGYTSAGPLDGWADRLADVLATVEHDPVARAAVRSIALHGIGAFHGRGHTLTHQVDFLQLDSIPTGVPVSIEDDGSAVWHEAGEQAWPEMAHPEWSAHVWAKARYRLLEAPSGRRGLKVGALALDPADVLAFDTDCLYLARDPGWPDDGKVGRFRPKAAYLAPLVVPNALEALRRTVDAGVPTSSPAAAGGPARARRALSRAS